MSRRPIRSKRFDGGGDIRAIRWVILPVALTLVLVLVYYLSLTTRPSISEILPAPQSRLDPGQVEITALIDSQRALESADMWIDGQAVTVSLEQLSDQRWAVTHSSVLPRGEREVRLNVQDASGREAEHTWRIYAGGPLIAPRAFLAGPPAGGTVRTGLATIQISATTFGPLADLVVEVNGESVVPVVESVEVDESEYFDDEDGTVFEWMVAANAILEEGEQSVRLVLSDEYGAEGEFHWTFEATTAITAVNALYFPETSQYVSEPFLSFWRQHDGNRLFGPPVGPAVVLETGEIVQYFRYARFEFNEDGSVTLGLLGREMLGEVESPPDSSEHPDSRVFDATGHEIHGPIRRYWENNGGVEIFGFPISREFEIETGRAQYFERALLENVIDPASGSQRVRLAPLGEMMWYDLDQNVLTPPEPAPPSQ